jgi:hypothetical protein
MSDIGAPRKEPPPSELRIGAPPRPVRRLSRRTLVVATALATALVFAAFWYALGIRPLRFTSGPELYNTNAKPTDALANLRDSYTDLTRPRPAPSLPQPVPQLGPPLPGDRRGDELPDWVANKERRLAKIREAKAASGTPLGGWPLRPRLAATSLSSPAPWPAAACASASSATHNAISPIPRAGS